MVVGWRGGGVVGIGTIDHPTTSQARYLGLPGWQLLGAVSGRVVFPLRLLVGDHFEVVGRRRDVVPRPVREIDQRLAPVVHRHHAADLSLEAGVLRKPRLHPDELVRPGPLQFLGLIVSREAHGSCGLKVSLTKKIYTSGGAPPRQKRSRGPTIGGRGPKGYLAPLTPLAPLPPERLGAAGGRVEVERLE